MGTTKNMNKKLLVQLKEFPDKDVQFLSEVDLLDGEWKICLGKKNKTHTHKKTNNNVRTLCHTNSLLHVPYSGKLCQGKFFC